MHPLLFYIHNKTVLKRFREGVKMIFVLIFFYSAAWERRAGSVYHRL